MFKFRGNNERVEILLRIFYLNRKSNFFPGELQTLFDFSRILT